PTAHGVTRLHHRRHQGCDLGKAHIERGEVWHLRRSRLAASLNAKRHPICALKMSTRSEGSPYLPDYLVVIYYPAVRDDWLDVEENCPYETPSEAPAGAPNVLLIMTDDVGFGASSTFGGPIQTPNFQRIADSGLRYNMFHTTA